jgi:hypothetical protein
MRLGANVNDRVGLQKTMTDLRVRCRAAALPPQSILGEASEGAVEAPSDI